MAKRITVKLTCGHTAEVRVRNPQEERLTRELHARGCWCPECFDAAPICLKCGDKMPDPTRATCGNH